MFSFLSLFHCRSLNYHSRCQEKRNCTNTLGFYYRCRDFAFAAFPLFALLLLILTVQLELSHAFTLKYCPDLLSRCSFSSICHAHSFLSLSSANYSLVRDGIENLCFVWSPLCSKILIWGFLPYYKQTSAAPEMTLFRDIFWRVRSTGRRHLKSLT